MGGAAKIKGFCGSVSHHSWLALGAVRCFLALAVTVTVTGGASAAAA